MKARTAQRLAILIVVLSLIGGTGFFTERYQVGRLASKQLERAELAIKAKDFAKAAVLYREHLQVFRDDLECKVKYADALVNVSRSLATQAEAAQIYYGVLVKAAGRDDVRLKLMKLKYDMNRFVSLPGREDVPTWI